MRPSRLVAMLFLPLLAAAEGRAQGSHFDGPAFFPWDTTEVAGPGPGTAFAVSALVPGLGQRMLGQRRFLVYAALEVAAWAYALNRRQRADQLAGEYRDIAWQAARRMHPGPRRDGEFDYYEAVLHYGSSGAYDADPGRPGLQPEERQGTYNGAVWTLARGLHPPLAADERAGSAARQAALAYYEANAIRPGFAWDWAGNTAARDRYAGVMRQSDDLLQAATTAFGVILANHLVSALDALISARLRRSGVAAAGRVGLKSRIEPDRDGPRWTAAIRVAWP